MEPGKLEEQIRKRLEERSIEPSAGAWGRLEKRLGSKESPKNARIWWYGLAAVFTGAVILLAVFGPAAGQDPAVVVDKAIEAEDQQRVEIAVEEVAIPNTDENKTITTKDNRLVREVKDKVEDPLAQPLAKKKGPSAETRKDVVVPGRELAEVNPDEEAVETIVDAPGEAESGAQELFDLQVDKVVAQIKSATADRGQVTAGEVDRLLREAQRELSSKKLLDKNTGKVDPLALLSEVEFELEQRFRDRVFEALGKGFQKIRTAVVERNY